MQHLDWKQEIKRNRLPCMECAWIVPGLCPRCTQGTLMVHTYVIGTPEALESYKGQCVTIGHCQHPAWKSAMLKMEKKPLKSKPFNFQYVIHNCNYLSCIFSTSKSVASPLLLGPRFGQRVVRPYLCFLARRSRCRCVLRVETLALCFRFSWKLGKKKRGLRWFVVPFFFSFLFVFNFGLKSSFSKVLGYLGFWRAWVLMQGQHIRTDLGSYSNSLNVFNFFRFLARKTGSNVSCDQSDLSYNLRWWRWWRCDWFRNSFSSCYPLRLLEKGIEQIQ